MENLTKEELNKVQSFLTEFNTLKMKIGDAVLAQHSMTEQVKMLKDEYNTYEGELMVKYGEDAMINVQTGEVGKKEDKEE